MIPSRLPSPPSSSSSAALSLHHCSLCSEVSDSIPSQYDTAYPDDSVYTEKRLYALQDLMSRGDIDPTPIAKALCPSVNIDIDESLVSLATHIGRTYLPRSPYLGNISTYDLQEALRSWDQGHAEIQLARELKDGKMAPPSTGGCWPARVAASDEGNATVFVGGLAGDVSEWYLAAVFSVFGPYTGVKVLPPKNGTTHCGFVHYVHRRDAEVVVRVMQGFEMMEHRLRISWGRSTSHQSSTRGSLGPSSDPREDTTSPRPMLPPHMPTGPQSINPSLIVEVAKHIDIKVAQEYLKLVSEKFNGDGAAFIETLKTVVAIKGVSPASSPKPSKQLLPPSSAQPHTAESIWYTGGLPSTLTANWHRSNDLSPLETASEESASRLATPPPVTRQELYQRPSQARRSYDWQGTAWTAPNSSPVDWAPAPKKRISTGLGLDFRQYGSMNQ